MRIYLFENTINTYLMIPDHDLFSEMISYITKPKLQISIINY